MKRRIFNIKGKRLVEGDANLTNQDEILVKELQDNRVALLENIDGKLVNIGGLEEEKEKRPGIVDTVVLAKHHLRFMPEVYEVEKINLILGKRNILPSNRGRQHCRYEKDKRQRPGQRESSGHWHTPSVESPFPSPDKRAATGPFTPKASHGLAISISVQPAFVRP